MSSKNFKTFMISLILLLLVITLAMAMAYVTNKQKNPDSGYEPSTMPAKKQFVCSMHPQVIQDNPGDCPICGMFLIEKINQSTVTTKKLFVCSMHPQVIQDNPGDCPICGMFLIEKINQSTGTIKKQFVCSMHPQVIQDNPGDCPICGMFLIEKINQDSNSADSMLINVVRPVNESVLGTVATVNPFHKELSVVIEASGIINFDPRRIRTVSARFGGLVERSFVKYQFQTIRKGQKIYEIYCPDIYTERWNYVKLVQTYPDQDSLTSEARNWLQLLGLTKGQIDSLKRAVKPDYHLAVYSDAEGYAVNADFDPESYFLSGSEEENKPGGTWADGAIGFNDGLIIETGTPLFKILNLKSLRADLKVRTEDIGLLKTGQKVILKDTTNPEQKFDATISQIEPLNGGLFQLVKIFLTDKEGRLKPGGQIQGQIMAGGHEALWVPRSSVINLGQKQAVFVMQNGRFIATTIKTGLQTGDKVEVLSGINHTSQIAANAFLLTDSDSFINPK